MAFASKGTGFFRDVLVAKYFGAGYEVDAFMVAVSLPMLISGGLGFAISTALVPLHRKTLSASGEIQANHLSGTAIGFGTVLSILLALFICLVPLPLINLIAPTLPDPTKILAVELVPWAGLYLVGLNLIYILTAVYHASHHFKIPAYSDLVFNVVIILVLIGLVLSLGIHSLILGYISGIFLCVGIQVFFLFKRKLPGFQLNVQGPVVKSLVLLATPMLFFDFSVQVGIVVENYFASGLSEGSISALNYAKRLNLAVIALVAVNVSRGVFPTFSQLCSGQKRDEMRGLFIKLNKYLIILFIPLSVFLIALRSEIIKILFMRGEFDRVALEQTSTVFLFYAAGLVMAAIEPVFLRSCYAFSNTSVPLISSCLSILLSVLLNFILTPIWGLAGIALSMNLAILVRVLSQSFFLRKKLGGLAIGETLKVGSFSLLCALVSLIPILLYSNDSLIRIISSMAFFFILYFGMGWYLMNREVRSMWRLLKQNLRFG